MPDLPSLRLLAAIPIRLALAAMALAAPADATPHSATAMLPERVLTCRLGRVANFDPSHEQTAAELRYDGFHPFILRLGATPSRAGAPPDITDAPDPVSPRTRILADPDGIAPQVTPRFTRVVDQWPHRVEMTSPIKGAVRNAIVLSLYDPARQTANLFMMRASELTRFDEAHMYQGQCRVALKLHS